MISLITDLNVKAIKKLKPGYTVCMPGSGRNLRAVQLVMISKYDNVQPPHLAVTGVVKDLGGHQAKVVELAAGLTHS